MGGDECVGRGECFAISMEEQDEGEEEEERWEVMEEKATVKAALWTKDVLLTDTDTERSHLHHQQCCVQVQQHMPDK